MSWDKKKDIFALMVGHGKSLDGSWDPGCTYSKYTEAELMYDITRVAVKWLRKSGVKVITDADDKNNRNMKASVSWANSKKAKYYMSLHCDYKLASAGVAPLYKTEAGRKMAVKIGQKVAKLMGMKWKGAFKRSDLFELNATQMVAVIFEAGAIKADLKYLKDYKKYGKALAKAICAFIGADFYVSNRVKLMRKTAAIVAYMNKHHFKYTPSWKDCGRTWDEAKKIKKSNCSCMISYGMQECGFLDKNKGQIFWCNGTKVACKGNGCKKQLLKVASITHPNRIPKNAGLKKGDVTGTKNNAHTQLFAGWNKKKQPKWFSWSPSDVGKKEPRHKPYYDNKKVNTIIRLK